MGLGPLANAVVQIEVGRSPLAAWAMNCMGPQDATMLTLLDHGTTGELDRVLAAQRMSGTTAAAAGGDLF
jgi:acyl-CoA dehydrogenase